MVEELKQQNRTIEVEVVLDSTDAARPPVRAGMTADLEIVLGRTDHALRVPTPAVIEGRRVLMLDHGRARAREFVPGRHNWDWTEVRSGLAAEDWVITSLDRAGLKDGVPVLPAERPSPGAR
jgi:HlyD family secretion protein